MRIVESNSRVAAVSSFKPSPVTRRRLLKGACATTMLLAAPSIVRAQEQRVIKIGLIQSMTGPLNTIGKAVVDGARLYVQQHGDAVAGRKIRLIVKDDATSPEIAKRLAQEMIVNDKVAMIGVGITPSALSVAPLATEAKIPTLVMVSAASVTVDRSPYMVRTSFTVGQSASVIADWAVRNGAKKLISIVNDWAPGVEAEGTFKDRIAKGGAQILASLRVPLANPDFAPFLQRARDLGPDTLFAVFPGYQAGVFAKQFLERGLDKSGIRLVGADDLTDDDELPGMTDALIGVVTASHYSALHDSPLNNAYAKDYEAAYRKRPNFISLGGYDGMHLAYEALKNTGGKADGDAVLAVMKGMKWESPRGPMSIDPETRDVVQNEYIRKVERVNGQLYNVEFAIVEAVKDPVRERRSNVQK
jgi:branched-chain amino acid transport system substrate-binding protein